MAPVKRSSAGSRSIPRITTVEDLPQDIWDVIVEELPLLDHYRAMATLIAPHARRCSSFPKDWFLEGLNMYCIGTPKFDSKGIQYDKSYEFYLTISELGVEKGQSIHIDLDFPAPGLGNEQDIDLEIESNEQKINTSQVPFEKRFVEMASDDGLLFFNIGELFSPSTPSRRQASFIVLNPVSFSHSILPPVSYMCDCPSSSPCSCDIFPLKLVVGQKEDNGLNSSHTAIYKAYVVEGRKGRNVFGDPQSAKKDSRGISNSWSFRISAYDSMTRSWSFTGLQWSGSKCKDIQVFPMEDETFYICASYYKAFGEHYIMYKFQNGVQVAKVKPPYTKKAKDVKCHDSCHGPSSCKCISTIFFEDEGEIFFFKITSWMGTFGPNCISATIWQLDKEAMVWNKLPTIPVHKLESFNPALFDSYPDIEGIFKWEGSLLVATKVYDNLEFKLYIAAFNISKKAWCKVPENFSRTSWCYDRWWEASWIHYRLWNCNLPWNVVDLDSFVFKPNVNIRA